MSAPAAEREFRTVGDARALPDNYVNPYYLEDLKKRVSVARIAGKLYAFDDLCKHEGCPLSAGLLSGTTLMCQCHGSNGFESRPARSVCRATCCPSIPVAPRTAILMKSS